MEESDDEPEDPAESNPFVSKGVCSCERQRSTIPAITLSHQAANVADAALSCIVNIRLPYVSLLWRAAEEDDQEGGASKCPIGLPFSPRQRYDPSGPSKASAPLDRKNFIWKTYCCVLRRNEFERFTFGKAKGHCFVSCAIGERRVVPHGVIDDLQHTPHSFQLRSEDVILSDYEQDMLNATAAFTISDFNRIPIQRHEGFLNLLSALCSQLGHRLTD
jgi:hypothetical protein